jgi:hypothetical protein
VNEADQDCLRRLALRAALHRGEAGFWAGWLIADGDRFAVSDAPLPGAVRVIVVESDEPPRPPLGGDPVDV